MIRKPNDALRRAAVRPCLTSALSASSSEASSSSRVKAASIHMNPKWLRSSLKPNHYHSPELLARILVLLVVATSPVSFPVHARAESMSGALAKAYGYNPDLNQQRAATRATDEGVPRATAGWRPVVSAT